MLSLTAYLAALLVAAFYPQVRAHTVLTYPGWRGNNLYTNGTAPQNNPDTIGIDFNSNGDGVSFPFGMQFMYPCGGMPLSTNRTKWPVQGGAVAFQPGFVNGNKNAFIYINIGITDPGDLAPKNYSHNAVPPFELTGPNNSYWPGSFCVPQVGMPANLSLEIGTNITIQVVTATASGAALYSCVDVTLSDPSEVAEVTPLNCFNSTDIVFETVFTTQALSSAASPVSTPAALFSIYSIAIITALYTLL